MGMADLVADLKLRRCWRCRRFKPLDRFYLIETARPDRGVNDLCRDCSPEYQAERRRIWKASLVEPNQVRCLACGAWWDRDAPDTPRFVAAHGCWSR